METTAPSRPELTKPLGPFLQVIRGPQLNLKIDLNFKGLADRPLVLGRLTGQVDLVLQSYQGLISRRHVLIYFRPEDQMLVAEDAGSSNGTRLNGAFLAGPSPLMPGDHLQVGDVEIAFLFSGMPLPLALPLAGPGSQIYPEDALPGIARLEVVSSLLTNLPPGAFSRLSPGHPFKIGRHSSCDLRLLERNENGFTTSRHQAEIREGQGKYILRESEGSSPTLIT